MSRAKDDRGKWVIRITGCYYKGDVSLGCNIIELKKLRTVIFHFLVYAKVENDMLQSIGRYPDGGVQPRAYSRVG